MYRGIATGADPGKHGAMVKGAAMIDPVLRQVRRWLAARGPGLTVIGIAGAQGSGKSTLVRDLAERLAGDGLRVATLSLDDLYLTRAVRQDLAARVHPLFATRGVPGTHDVALGLVDPGRADAGRGGALAPVRQGAR